MLETPVVKDNDRAERSGRRRAGGPLRIAFLSYRSDPRVGGQGVYLAQATRALAARGHKVDVLSGPPSPDLAPEVGLVEIPSLDLYAQPHNGHLSLRLRHLLSWTDLAEYFGHLSGKFMEPYTFGRRAARYLRAHAADYDVVIDNQSLGYGLLDIKRSGLPVVGVIHHPIRRDLELALDAEPEAKVRWLIRRWYSFLSMQEHVAPRLDRVIVVSKSAGADVASYLRVLPERMTAIPLGVDQTVFRPQPDLRRRERRILTTASADVPLKGLGILIQAYADLLPAFPNLELVVIGKLKPDGPTGKLINSLGLTERISFISDLSGEEMAEQYARATICVTPSLYEGFGLPAAEAMSCASPVIVTDGGSLPEVVGEAGVVVRRGDSEALATAIAQLLDDPAKRLALSEASRRRAREVFSWDRAGAAYEAVLEDAVIAAC